MNRWMSRLADLQSGKAAPRSLDGVQNGQIGQKPEQPTNFGQIAHFAQPKVGRWMLLVQRWGQSIGGAAELVERVCQAAGAPGTVRRERVGELFDKLLAFDRWPGTRKINWLADVAAEMEADSLYWPPTRPDQTARGRTNREKLLRVMKRAPNREWSKGALARATQKSEHAISALVLVMKNAGQIVCVRPGIYALPGAGEKPFVSATHQIITALIAVRGHSMTRTELMTVTSGAAIDRPLHTLVHSSGVLVSPKRGMFALSPATLSKIRHGEAIQIGHNRIVIEPCAIGRHDAAADREQQLTLLLPLVSDRK